MSDTTSTAIRGPLGAIDVGTNSVHLVVARVTDGDRFDVITSEKEMVRLGTGAGDMKYLAPDAIDRGVAALARFKRIADGLRAPVRAVATSAVREAENRDEFLTRARDEAGIDVEVISGTEEARLIHLGVIQAVPVFDQRVLVCDIGGGSTELVIGHRGDVLVSRSFKLGAIRLTERFFGGNRIHPAAPQSCLKFVRAAISPFVREARRLDHQVAVGSSGTVLSIASMIQAARREPAPLSFNNFAFSRKELDACIDRLVRAETITDRRKIPGLDAKRADIIVGGAMILLGVMDELAVSEMRCSDYALREGVLLDTVQRTHGGSLHHLRDLSRRGVLDLARLCDDDPVHSAHVARLATQLFDGTAALHGLDVGCREYLEAGALLANVGLFVSHTRHHLHSYYLIRNSERLLGFTDQEVEIIALVARYHRKSAPKPSHTEFAVLRPDDQRTVRILAGLLRVAIGLDRSHDQRVRGLRVEPAGDGRIRVVVERRDDADISLELYTADMRKDLLENVLGRPVVIGEA